MVNRAAIVSRWGSVVAISAIVARTASTRAVGLDPQSLWYDDVWVASLTRLDSFGTAVLVPAPVPPAFLGALWIAARLISDAEVALQLIPFVGALLTIPLLAYLVSTVTASHAFGVLAAGLLALNANSAHYSVFVKPYATDQLATVVFLLVAVWVFRKRQSSRLAAAAPLGVVMAFWSLPSVFSSATLIMVATLGSVAVVRTDTRRLWPSYCGHVRPLAQRHGRVSDDRIGGYVLYRRQLAPGPVPRRERAILSRYRAHGEDRHG